MLPTEFTNPRPAYLEAAKSLLNNPGQTAAYDSTGNCAILAGPGSGKTKTVTIKIARLLQEIRAPRGIACITYSTECARELKQRLKDLGVAEKDNLVVGTVHGFCLNHVVRPYARLCGFAVPDPIVVPDSYTWMTLFERALIRTGLTENPYYVKTRVERYRRTHLNRDDARWRRDDEECARVIELFEKLLHEAGFIDFDDMVLIALQIIERTEWVRKSLQARFPVLVVDEYQDLGLPLHRIVLQLCFKAGIRVIAVGDPDQSIYGFAGADPQLLRDLAEMRGIEKIPLRMNYRSGRTIVAGSMVALGEARDYAAAGDYDGTVNFWECPNGIEEQAQTICGTIIPQSLAAGEARELGDIAVLYVDKHDATVITRAVTDSGLKYVGGDKDTRYQLTPLTRWLEDCAAWCAGGWAQGKPSLSSLIRFWIGLREGSQTRSEENRLRAILVRFLWNNRNGDRNLKDWLDGILEAGLDNLLAEMPSRPDEQKSFTELRTAADDPEKLGNWPLAAFGRLGGSSDHLSLVTLHSSKGLEFDVVIIMGMDQGRIPPWRSTGPEPRRLFYVGLTRAKYEVHLVYSGWYQNQYGRRFDNGPSEYLLELRRGLQDN